MNIKVAKGELRLSHAGSAPICRKSKTTEQFELKLCPKLREQDWYLTRFDRSHHGLFVFHRRPRLTNGRSRFDKRGKGIKH